MKTLQKKYLSFFSLALLGVFFFDYYTKEWAASEAFETKSFIDGFFYLTNVQTNDGIAFGIDIPLLVQIIGSLVIIGMLLNIGFEQFFQKKSSEFQTILLGAVIGGGLGNLVDRIVHGHVIDFIVIQPLPVFNVADVGITVGLLLLFVTMLVDQKKSRR